jgi:PDZ domain-containing protein
VSSRSRSNLVGEAIQQQERERPARPGGQPEGAGSARAKLLIPLLAPLVFMLLTVPTGFLIESPGPSFDLQEDLTVTGAETYPSQGELLLTAVSLQESRLIYHLIALFDDGFELIKVSDYLGEELDTEEQDIVDIVITFLSQDTAVVAGLQEVGIPVEVEGMGVLMVAVAPDYPAYGVLNPGDVITSINGEAIDSMDRFSELVDSVPEGEAVSLEVRGIDQDYATIVDEGVQEGTMQRPDLSKLLADEVREVEIQPVYNPELGRAIIGISGREYFTYTASVDVAWDLEKVKGPSAGLMMTLSLVNALTPEDLTWGEKIAGTGEITMEGDVGPIGGLPFKIIAAEREGAEVFIYPVENQDELEGFSTGLELFAVDDLDDALEVLRGLE